MKSVIVKACFDGDRYRGDGPTTIGLDGGRIADVLPGEFPCGDGESTIRAEFALPGLVDAHCHLFLDGGELDSQKRSRYLDAPFEEMVATAQANVGRSLARGVTLVRDAGDRFGVNHRVRGSSSSLTVRSCGTGLRRKNRYGSFIAREVDDAADIVAAVRQLAESSDDIKIVQTGIIDFETGRMKGGIQFDLEALSLIVKTAQEVGLKTFAHCSGVEGIETAVRARVDSIEHGFFMTSDLLRRMADQGTAWVPTFSPVEFQWRRPEIAGWAPGVTAGLRRILDSHAMQVTVAAELGVPLVAGSDAGSHGVSHGDGLVNELLQMLACGLSMEQVLRSATSLPRQLWGASRATIAKGCEIDLVLLAGDPFVDPANLSRTVQVLRNG